MDICDLVDLRLAACAKRGAKRERLVKALATLDPGFDPNLDYYAMYKHVRPTPEGYWEARRRRRIRLAVPLAMKRRRQSGETLRSLAKRYGTTMMGVKLTLAYRSY